MRQIQGKLVLFRVSGEFELSRFKCRTMYDDRLSRPLGTLGWRGGGRVTRPHTSLKDPLHGIVLKIFKKMLQNYVMMLGLTITMHFEQFALKRSKFQFFNGGAYLLFL